MNIVIMPLTLIITIVLALALGVASGYYAILGILYAFNRNRTAKPGPMLVANTGPTGD